MTQSIARARDEGRRPPSLVGTAGLARGAMAGDHGTGTAVCAPGSETGGHSTRRDTARVRIPMERVARRQRRWLGAYRHEPCVGIIVRHLCPFLCTPRSQGVSTWVEESRPWCIGVCPAIATRRFACVPRVCVSHRLCARCTAMPWTRRVHAASLEGVHDVRCSCGPLPPCLSLW